VTECQKSDAYIEALGQEILRRRDFIDGDPSTIYIGGGTPSLLSLDQLSRITDMLRGTWRLDGVQEFTVELNPDDITPESVNGLRHLGVNRVSMGVQSFDDTNLKWMRRRHTSGQACRAYKCLREAGFDNISMDLIFGYKSAPMSDDDAMKIWERDIMTMIELRPEHISAYQMSIEPGSILALSGKYTEPSQEFCQRCYYTLLDMLAEAGYQQYEISNFSLPGFHSRHNSSYWERIPYVGLGAAAHSFDGAIRSWNPSDLKEYIANADAGWGEDYSEFLSEKEALEEKIMLGLRKTEGVVLSEAEYSHLRQAIEKIEDRELLLHYPSQRRIALPRESLFISDSIIADLF
jgi:oxygen-independent coproporphyrinogen-3 oxidase